MRLSFALLAFGAVLSHARAEILYSVQPVGDNTRVKVTMRFSAKAGPLELQMPNWAPGSYDLQDYGKRVADFRAFGADGQGLTFDHSAFNSWKATLTKAGQETIEYTVPVSFSAGALHYSGPGTYMYLANRKDELCRLRLDLPTGWKVATGLDPAGSSQREFVAPTYDVLADNPVTAGDFIDLHYTSHGKPITIAMRGDLRSQVDQQKLMKLCKTISDAQGDFFGGLPFNQYVWHFLIFGSEDGAGGLEHLSSTQIGLARGVGPAAARVCAHEFFHLWNVKRIRSKVLGPFDYTKLPKTGALYWLEGVTDYYASLFMVRSGYLGSDSLLKDLADNLANVRSNPARLEVSPYESSLRENETDNGRGNGDGYRISYYNLGWLAGFCLDFDLRARTNGKKSLDDVERALWRLCKDGRPGFEEGEIERQYVLVGGSKEFFEKTVMRPGELPVEEMLARAGLQLKETKEPYVDKGFDFFMNIGSPVISVSGVRPFAAQAGLSSGDVVLAVNEKTIGGKNSDEAIAQASAALGTLKAGQPLSLKVRHDGAERQLSITPEAAANLRFQVVEAPAADAKKLEFRQHWYSGH